MAQTCVEQVVFCDEGGSPQKINTEHPDLIALAARPHERVRIAPRRGEEAASINFTGGTSGVSKGVLLPHGPLALSAQASVFYDRLVSRDVNLCCISLDHTGGIHDAVKWTMTGGTNVMIGGWEAKLAASLIVEHRPSWIYFWVPTMARDLMRHPEWDSLPLDGVKCIISGETVPPELQQQLLDRGFDVSNSLGMSETMPVASSSRSSHTATRRRSGRAGSRCPSCATSCSRTPTPAPSSPSRMWSARSASAARSSRPATSTIPSAPRPRSTIKAGCTPATSPGRRRRLQRPGLREQCGGRVELVGIFGQTEAIACHRFWPNRWSELHGRTAPRTNYVGIPTPLLGSTVVDADGVSLHDRPGEAGEAVYRSPAMSSGYYRDEAATAEAFRDGWFHSGDMCEYGEDGLRVMIDRYKDVVKSGGENVSSIRVETVLAGHPSVSRAAVVGVPDARWGEAVTGVVVPADGAVIDDAALIAFCRERLAGFETPKRIVVVDELPTTIGGKVLKYRLRAALRA